VYFVRPTDLQVDFAIPVGTDRPYSWSAWSQGVPPSLSKAWRRPCCGYQGGGAPKLHLY